MSSEVHGDPATPVFEANAGDPVRFRVLMGSDRGRAHSFLLHGHGWPNQPTDPASMIRTNRGGLLPGRGFVVDLVGGAGGRQTRSGDYLFRDGNLVSQVNAGLWGIMRVPPHGRGVRAQAPRLSPGARGRQPCSATTTRKPRLSASRSSRSALRFAHAPLSRSVRRRAMPSATSSAGSAWKIEMPARTSGSR